MNWMSDRLKSYDLKRYLSLLSVRKFAHLLFQCIIYSTRVRKDAGNLICDKYFVSRIYTKLYVNVDSLLITRF